MTPAQHNRAKQVFLAACERPPELRGAFVEHECADDVALREHVESLLLHHSNNPAETRGAACDAGIQPSIQPATESATGELAPGSVIAQRYQIISLLGRGGMGEVYLANDQLLQQRVALKFLSPELAGDPAWVVRLVREVRSARRVTNSTVCRVFDIQVGEDGPAYISMEYVDGEPLSSLLRRIGRPPGQKALEIARQLCIGLSAAHAVGILHRDLKPGNIMIDGQGAVRIMDFGLAAPRAEISDTEIRVGTPAYMAPELFAGTDVSVRSDIYALGLILYELFAGRPTFDGQSFTELARQHQRSNPPPLLEFSPYVDPAIERLIRRCLEKDPGRRPESAMAVAAELPDTNALAIALAAGVTPTAAQVARAGSHVALSRGLSLGLLAGVAALLGLVVWLGPRSGVWPEMQHAKPPAVLLDAARTLCDKFDSDAEARFEAHGLTYRASDEFFESDSAGRSVAQPGDANRASGTPTRLATGETSSYTFWYRRSPHALSPRSALNVTFGGGRASLTDPPRAIAGATTCVFDNSGQLVAFEAIPLGRTGQPREADWSGLLAATGVMDAEIVAGNPVATKPWYADKSHAWQARDVSGDTPGLRAEGGETAGRPVWLAVLRAGSDPNSLAERLSVAGRMAFSSRSRAIVLAGAVLGLVPLAWRNLRQSRGDPRGGTRLALLVVAARVAAWVLSAAPAATLGDQFVLLLFAILGALTEGVLVWIGYVAIEPSIRRHWPETIVSWTRVLAGQFRDPLVCRDILIGALVGVTAALLFILDRRVVAWSGLETLVPLRLLDLLDPLLGTRFALAAGLHTLLISLYISLLVVALLVLGSVLLGRPTIAAVLTALVLVPIFVGQVAHPAISWLPLLCSIAIVIAVATRRGLVAVVTALFTVRLLVVFPLTFSPGHWAFDASVGVVLVILAVAAFGAFAACKLALAVGSVR